MNQKFGIQNGTVPVSTERPKLGYYCIGNRGHQLVVGGEGIPKPEPVQHSATDAALYGHIPFVLRLVTNDLTSTERARYALRREEQHNGDTYVAYYLRRLDLTNVTPIMNLKTVTNGVEQTTAFVPNSSNLNPTPPDIINSGVNVTDGQYVSASAVVTLSLTETDALELINVAKVLYNDEYYSIISEIGLCTGIDKVVQVTSSIGGTFNFNEAIVVQIASHIPAMIPLKFSNTGTDITLSLGATEPLFSLSSL